jgi:hypothetical protein
MLVNIPSPRKPFVESLNYPATKAYVIIMMTLVFSAIISVLQKLNTDTNLGIFHIFFCVKNKVKLRQFLCHWIAIYIQGADKSLARPTSRCILFDGENISLSYM